MATARKLPSGSWRCQVYSHTEKTIQADGTTKEKRIYKSFTCDVPGAKGKRLCEQMAADWAAEKENAQSVLDISLGEAIDRYITSRESVLSPRTVMDYKCTQRNYLKSIIHLKITTISQEDIQKAINFESKTHSPKTIRNIHGLVSAVMRSYRPNFALNTSLPKKTKPKLYIPSEKDVKALMAAVTGTKMEIPVLLAAFGPMRRGEICALTASDIDGKIVHVCKNMVKSDDKKWIVKCPKTYAGDRVIAFPEFVIQKLSPKQNPDERIVQLTPDAITARFCRILKSNNIPHFRFHDLRHPYVKPTTKKFITFFEVFRAAS